MNIKEALTQIRPLEDNLTLDEKVNLLAQVVLSQDDMIEKLKADLKRLEEIAGYAQN
jgi:hypothetical protein